MKQTQTLYGAMRQSLFQFVKSVRQARKNRRGPVILRVCSWCQCFMGVKDAGGLKETILSHGMCRRCAAAWRREVDLHQHQHRGRGNRAARLRL